MPVSARKRFIAVACCISTLAGCSTRITTEETTVMPTNQTVESATQDVGSTTIAETPITIPIGVLAAMPFQNRLDVAQGIFQIKLINGTSELLDVVAIQFIWEGLTTQLAHRENHLVPGDRIDYPVLLAPANCLGDGTRSTMPGIQSAIVNVTLRDGRVIDVPVYDVKHFARKLYLDDCERQYINKEVDIRFADLHGATLEGRPVTEGVLRLTRRQSSDTVVVTFISNTINYTFIAIAGNNGPVATLPADKSVVEVPIRFIEGRCDAHALSESSQPFNFYALLDLGDGIERSFVTMPAKDDRILMRDRVEMACEILNP